MILKSALSRKTVKVAIDLIRSMTSKRMVVKDASLEYDYNGVIVMNNVHKMNCKEL